MHFDFAQKAVPIHPLGNSFVEKDTGAVYTRDEVLSREGLSPTCTTNCAEQMAKLNALPSKYTLVSEDGDAAAGGGGTTTPTGQPQLAPPDPDSASCTPIYGSTNPYALNMNEIIGYNCSGGGRGGSTGMPQYDPQSDPDIPVPCDMLVACADGTTEEACYESFAPLCTGHGGVIGDPFNRMFPDDLMVQQPVEDDACEGVRCIKVYKPCPEGYIDVSKCCPNTGNCALDPNYVIPNVGLVQMQPIGGIAAPALPIGNTPSTNFDTNGSAFLDNWLATQPVRSSTPLPFERTATAPTAPTTSTSQTSPTASTTSTTSTTTTPTTETSTAEEPKQGGLGILVLGLIALEALAT